MPRLTQAEYLLLQSRLEHGQDRASRQAEVASTEDEATIHGQIEAECRARGWYVIHSRMDRRSTIGVGAPDFVVAGDSGRVWMVEVKTRRGRLTGQQEAAAAWLRKLGHEYHVVRSLEEFRKVVD